MTDRKGRTTRRDDDRNWSAFVWQITRWILVTVGIVVFGFGLVIVFVPGTDRLVPIEAAIAVLGSDYWVVAALGLLALGLAILLIVSRHLRGVTEAVPPDVEGIQSASYPGERFDLQRGRLLRRGSDRTDHRERLKEAAVQATMRAEGCTRTDAIDRVDEGTWTDDVAAADYLSGTRRFRWLPRIPGRERRSIRRAVDAIERLSEKKERTGRNEPRTGTDGEAAR